MSSEHGGHGGHHGPGFGEINFDWEPELSLVGGILGILFSFGLSETLPKQSGGHGSHGDHGGGHGGHH